MAYRPLVEGDKVKVKPLGVMHPQLQYSNNFGKVLYVSANGAEVEFNYGSLTSRVWLRQSELMVAHEDLSVSIYRFRDDLHTYVVSEDDECPYADWSKTDLIDKINELERKIDELEK